MTLWIQLAIALAIAGSAFVGGWQTRSWKAGADDRDRMTTEARDAQRRSDQNIAAATGYEAAKAAQRPKTIIVTREIASAIQADPDCSQRPLPDRLRDALTRAAADNDQPIADGPVSAASSAGPFDLGKPRAGLLGSAGGTSRLSGAP